MSRFMFNMIGANAFLQMLAEPASAQAAEKTVIAGFNSKLVTQIASFEANNTGVSKMAYLLTYEFKNL